MGWFFIQNFLDGLEIISFSLLGGWKKAVILTKKAGFSKKHLLATLLHYPAIYESFKNYFFWQTSKIITLRG